MDEINRQVAIKIRNNYNKEELNILDFYPELDLKPPYTGTGTNLINPIKPYQLFPFFKTVLVDVPPIPDEDLFKMQYGLSVEELIDLEREGKVAIRLSYPYINYHNLENDYLDPIISRRPPSARARDLNYSYLINDKFLETLEKEDFFKGKLFGFGSDLSLEMGMIDPIAIASYDIMNDSGSNFFNFDEEIFVNKVKSNCQKLSLLGYGDVNKFLRKMLEVGSGRLDWAYVYSSCYTSFLTDPTFNSLDGTHLVNNNVREVLNDLFVRNNSGTAFKGIVDENDPFPYYDVGKMLTEEMITATPISLEQSKDIDYSNTIKALEHLENAVNKKDIEEITDRTHELKAEINVANQIVMDMNYAANKVPKGISRIGFSIGMLGSLAQDPHTQSLSWAISGIIGGLGECDVLKPAIETLLKFKRDNHVLYLYNNYEKYEINEYNLDGRILNHDYPLNNPLIDKYKYYDSIYKKIPILRVMIDIDTRLVIGDGPHLKIKGLPNDKLEEKIRAQFEKDFPKEFWKITHKHLRLYGIAYILRSKETYHIINPKFIKPIYENNELLSYECIAKNGKKQEIEKERVICINPSNEYSIVEAYIILFDQTYPDLTQKGIRPKLLYDTYFENMQTASKSKITDFENTKKLLLKSLEIPEHFKNVYDSVRALNELGDLHRMYNRHSEALVFYERAQDCLNGNAHSNILKKFELELCNKILETNNHLLRLNGV
ncbi:tetratricopeptide repeat protein [Methanobacterium aggregans]|uniref:tetratricopeptide repeat protein n=1 Tax=Methanobacterium aggregans TaxID=1615586 RepID=UPI001AE2DA55|nr:tetratricopeptide repeat protein [Methanobacterium aggregans]MBP2044948.1 hypothetical protein [Methanobacterium aggregans]